MTRLDRSTGLAAALAATLGLVWASTVSLPHAPADAVLRLAWSARPERVEDCRPQSAEALANLPPHMRQTLVCEGTTAAYRLEVLQNGSVIDEQTVRGGGLRHDRPLHVLREIRLPPGEADIRVSMIRIDEPPAGGVAIADDGRAQPRSERGEAVPASLTFEQRLRFQSGEVILVTYDPDLRVLFARTTHGRTAR
jgi:hypothetical protein